MANSFEKTPPVLSDIAAQLPPEFALQEYLGEGGHGIVLKALHKTLQKTVALKLLKTDHSEEQSKSLLRLQNEAKILGKLDHKNIVKIYQMGSCLDQTPFLVCEYLEGITLAQYLEKHKTLGPKQLVQVFSQVLDALIFAHENGLLHRDIKPSNIMVLSDHQPGHLEVKLLDFGIARDFDTALNQPMGLTRTIQISGSAPYMSPEQCKGNSLDLRSDLYSVGCVLFECLSGRPPFEGETPMHTRYMQIHEHAKLPDEESFTQTESRSAAYRLALKALSKNPDDRPQTAEKFKLELIKSIPLIKQREQWTPKSHRLLFNKSMTVISVGILLTIALSSLVILSSTRKILTPAPKAADLPITKVKSPGPRAVSAEGMVQVLEKRFADFRNAGDLASMVAGLKLIADIDACLPRTKSKGRFLNYLLMRMRAALLEKLDFTQESISSWNETLELCKDAKGLVTAEAIDALNHLAQIELSKHNYTAADTYANKAVHIAKDTINDMTGQARILAIPSFLDNREKVGTYETYRILSESAEQRNQPAEELTYRKLQDVNRLKAESVCESIEVFLRMANLTAQLKNKTEAYKLVKEREQAISVLMTEERINWRLPKAYYELGSWYLENGFRADAVRCEQLATKLNANLRGIDRDDVATLISYLAKKLKEQK